MNDSVELKLKLSAPMRKAIKIRAARDGSTMNAVVVSALAAYLGTTPTDATVGESAGRDAVAVLRFLEECCTLHPGTETPSRDLYDGFCAYVRSHGLSPVTDSVFGALLRAAHTEITGTRRRRNGKLTYLYQGVTFRPSDNEPVTVTNE